MFSTSQKPSKESECNLGLTCIDQKTKNYELPPENYDLKEINNAFKRIVELKADGKSITVISSTQHELVFKFWKI